VNGDYLELMGRKFPVVSFPFTEPHNLLNACMAALLAYGLMESRRRGSASIERIVEGLRRFTGLAHRMEWLGEKDGVRVVNNSMCTNPAAVVSSAESVPAVTHLLIGGVNKGLDFAPLAEYLATHSNKPYLFGSDAQLLDNMLGEGYSIFGTLDDAFRAATIEARPGEVIMLAPGCASTDQFRDFRDRGEAFKTIAKEWLES
jgi:UDP-N-acetylmuramoylalanine--D-glutamate ligase